MQASLNALAPALASGDRIIATLDLDPDGIPENNVREPDDNPTPNNNNTTSKSLNGDLVANSIDVLVDVTAGTTDANVVYTVNSPASSAPFSLKVGLDRDGDGLIDDPDGLLADEAIVDAGDLTPGVHQVRVTGLRAALNGLATPITNGDA
ncbi:MAG: hypothetical protein V3T70_01765, partial [Phycisphaerae bacterium]